MLNLIATVRDAMRRLSNASVGIALGLGLFGRTTEFLGLLSRQRAELIGIAPLILLIWFMTVRVFVHGMAINYRFIKRVVAWIRQRWNG